MPLPKAGTNAFLSNSFLIFITRFFPSLANLVVMIWYSRQLAPAVYGSYQHFWIQLFTLYPLICFGIHVLIITYSGDQLKRLINGLNKKSYLLYALWVCMIACVFASLQATAIGISFVIPFLFIIVYSLSVILESYHIVFRNFGGLIVSNVLYAALYCWIHIWVLHHGFSISTIFLMLMSISVGRLLVYGIMAIPTFRSQAKAANEAVIPVSVRSLWLHLGLYDVLQMLSSYIDKFIISLLLSSTLSAIYYNGAQNIPFLPLLLSAAGSAVLMQLSTGDKSTSDTDAAGLMNRSGRVLSSIVFPLFFFLLVYSRELFIVLLTARYEAAIPIFVLSTLVIPLRAYSFTTVLQRLHKGSIINTGAIAELLLACALMYPLYLWIGLPGVALSFVISTYFQAFFYLFYSSKLLKVSMFQLLPAGNWLIKLIVFGSVFIAIHYLSSLYFTQKIALILGIATMALLIIVSLWLEYKNKEAHVINPQ